MKDLPRPKMRNLYLPKQVTQASMSDLTKGIIEVAEHDEYLKKLYEIQPLVNTEQNQIVGTVIYIDNFGNVISNITQNVFHNIGKGRDFEIIARNYNFTKVYTKYNEIVDFEMPENKRQDDGKRLAIFNSANYLEISLYRSNLNTVGGASSLLGLKYRDNITVRFK